MSLKESLVWNSASLTCCHWAVRKQRRAAVHVNRTCIQSLIFSVSAIDLHLSSCHSETSHSVHLAADKVVNANWESFTVWFRTLIAFRVLARCVNTEVVFSFTHSLTHFWYSFDHKLYQAAFDLDFYMWCILMQNKPYIWKVRHN